MGKNADKRRARRAGEGPAAGSTATSSTDDLDTGRSATLAGARASPLASTGGGNALGASREGAPAWWATNMLPPPVEVVDDDGAGSLSRALFDVTTLLGAALARPHDKAAESMQRVAAAVARVVEADMVHLLRLEPGDGDLVPAHLVLTAAHGAPQTAHGVFRIDVGDGVAGHVAQTGETVRVDDAPRDPRFSRQHGQRTEMGSMLAVPLRVGRKVLGVLTVARREIRAFSPADEARITTTASAIALDLEQARLYREAVACPLTGLVSRVALMHAMPREVEIARRYQTHLSLAILDADGLGNLNDVHGRAATDRFLRESATRLARTVRAADLVARFGGDEIAVLLPMTPPNQARATAKRLVRALSTPPLDPGCTWSVGVGTLQAHIDEDAAGLLLRVDRAVLQAKEQGGNTIVSAAVDRRDV
jgi:diguanylate cyclase (GGDEF)-like protein